MARRHNALRAIAGHVPKLDSVVLSHCAAALPQIAPPWPGFVTFDNDKVGSSHFERQVGPFFYHPARRSARFIVRSRHCNQLGFCHGGARCYVIVICYCARTFTFICSLHISPVESVFAFVTI